MDEVGVVSPEMMRQLVQDYLSRKQMSPQVQHNYPDRRPTFEVTQQPRVVILDATLAVATNSKTGATSCLATVCYWSMTDEEFTESVPVQQITVWNHSESTAHAINTFGVARWIMGHWMFFGDCAAMAAR